MDRHLGLGPVFFYECLTASRRWQVFAIRAGFVGILLAVLAVTWLTDVSGATNSRRLASAGQSFFYAITFLELTAVLLVAPAATAGAICLDRARGSLAHLMSTELSSSEIVLGKLAARVLPSVGLVLSTIPIMAMSSLLGGIDMVAMLGAGLVTLGTAAVGAALAMVLSLRGRRAHEVLIVTYMLLLAWVLTSPILWIVSEILPWVGPGSPLVTFYEAIDPANPYTMAFAPYSQPGSQVIGGQILFLLACLVGSGGLAGLAIARLRHVAFLRDVPRANSGRIRRLADRLRGLVPGPSLDGNPVLWRQWHYTRPSIWSRGAWWSFTIVVLMLAAIMVAGSWTSKPGNSDEMVVLIDLLYLFVGLLFVAVHAPMALADERTRGSLDILLSTPLSSGSIVWAKWWGIFRAVPPLVVIPGVVQLVMANPDRRWTGFFVSSGLLLASGALMASFGLALSLWTPRLGRALGLSIGAYVLLTLGAFFVGSAVTSAFDRSGQEYSLGVYPASPTIGVALIAQFSTERFLPGTFVPDMEKRWSISITSGIAWAVSYATLAVGLLGLILLTFDHCLGRVRERRPPTMARSARQRSARPRLQGAAN